MRSVPLDVAVNPATRYDVAGNLAMRRAGHVAIVVISEVAVGDVDTRVSNANQLPIPTQADFVLHLAHSARSALQDARGVLVALCSTPPDLNAARGCHVRYDGSCRGERRGIARDGDGERRLAREPVDMCVHDRL